MAQPGREASSPWDTPSNDEGDGGDSSSQPTSTSSPPQPIMLSGSEGFSINTEMQGQMPTQLAPATGTTLTGDVGTIDSSVWVGQSQGPKKDSILKGIGITCLFSFFMVVVPMIMIGWADDSWDDSWHTETLNVDWDESGLNGTFRLTNTPIQECSVNIDDNSGSYYYNEPDSFRVEEDCGPDGSLIQYTQVTRAEFAEGRGELSRATFDNLSEGEAVFTVYPRYYERPNDSIELHLQGTNLFSEIGVQSFDESMTPLVFMVDTTNWTEPCPDSSLGSASQLSIIESGDERWLTSDDEYMPAKEIPYTECHLTYTDYHYEFTVFPDINERANNSIELHLPDQGGIPQHRYLGQQTFDENLTPLIFPVYTNDWGQRYSYCHQSLEVVTNNQNAQIYYPEHQYRTSPPMCPDMVYYNHYVINVGSIDHNHGYGELFLSEPLEEGAILTIDYETESDNFVADFAPCFGSLFSFVLFVVWIVQIVRNFQAGLTNKGTGMLVGIIPGVIFSFISVFIIALILFGF